ncbi:RNA-directed DNA polymerase [Desulfobacula sp.]|uniref:RNA-directed DNA polymerase n=1 Tax=Desulfobacula sp. TaxID=2593537 RepID=UPI00260D6404|nr:RNA-directed DNA polymerase [Desulfobacula sp.]
MALVDLLSRGYFPKELPRPFVTGPFATLVTSTAQLPGDYLERARRGSKLRPAKVCRYSHARGGLLRRKLDICNPLHYYLLSKELISNWPSIANHISGTPLAATSPEFKNTGRAINGQWPRNAQSHLAQVSRLGRKYVLLTDISRFYHSIYTHSIPWAIHTKSVAKANRKFTLLGNKIDYWVRNGQDGQTIGIPIGPDTSLVLAELIMQRCDEALITKIPQVKGYRFIDDYELSFDTRTEAEDAFHVLETCLSDFELALNPKKTEVLELPLPLETSWATKLKLFSFRNTKSGQAADLESFINIAFSLHRENPGDSVLQFAVACLRSVNVNPSNWDLFQRLLLLCVVPNPASFPYVLEQIISRANTGAIPLKSELEEVTNNLIVNHSALKHSSEVANAAWACLALPSVTV